MKRSVIFDSMQHGVTGLRISVYSEKYFDCPPIRMNEYFIFHLAKGCLLLGIGDKQVYAKAGDTFWINPNTPYYIEINENTSKSGEFHYYSIAFDISMLGGEEDLGRRFLKNIKVNERIKLSQSSTDLLPKMREWDISKPAGYEMYLKHGLVTIISDIIQSGQYVSISNIKRSGAEKYSDAANEVIKYIEEHYSERTTIEEISQIIGYSKSHTLRIFKQATGMGIIEYLNRYRVEKSCFELVYTSKKLTQIASDNGFEYEKSYSKVFKECIGMSPTKYRKYARGNK